MVQSSEQHQPVPVQPGLLVFLLLLVAGYAVYSGMFGHGFIHYDDYPIIVNRIHTYDGLTFENLKLIFWSDLPREEPLMVRDLTYLINASVFGPLNPRGYLLGNFILHIAASWLVYLLGLRLTGDDVMAAGLAALLFVVHPIHVESVAWISSRKDPLYVTFYLASFLVYVSYLKNRRWGLLPLSLLLFVCSLFSKAAAISFFATLICYRLAIKGAEPLKKAELVFGALVLGGTLLFVQWYTGVLQTWGILRSGLGERDWSLWLLSNCEHITFYIHKLILPANLSPLYDFPSPPLLFARPLFLAWSIAVTGALLLLFIYFLRHRHRASPGLFLLLFFFCALIPYMDFARVNIFVADRYLYLASVPFCIGASIVFFRLFSAISLKPRVAAVFIMAAVCCYLVFYGVTTTRAVKIWESSESFWSHANRHAPARIEPYVGLMEVHLREYMQNREDPSSITLVRKAEQIGLEAIDNFCSDDGECPIQLFKLATSMGRVAWLLQEFERADGYFNLMLKLNPDFTTGRHIYLLYLVERGNFAAARQQLEILRESLNPNMDQRILEDINTRLDSISPQIGPERQ